ncbi:MAG TPA: DegT/DnrJ/EryC1/StrS family aminotransferase [Solirubrobacterales bacterium]
MQVQPELADVAPVERDPEPVPFARLDNAEPKLFAELMAAVERVARTGMFTGGEEVVAFERELAAYCGAEHTIGVSSGTEALALALRALEIGPGDEVVVPANSFIATAEAVTLVGATPRFADVDPTTETVTAETVAESLTPATRCLIPVHLRGRTVDLDPLLELARERDLRLVEDACQAHGAVYRGRRVGPIGDLGCFSFYPAKNLGAWGDGGAVVTDDGELAERLRLLRAHGELARHDHRIPGTTARLDAIQAALLRIKLRRLDAWNDRRREIAADLTAQLAGASVTPAAPVADGHDHVYHHFAVLSDERDLLRSRLTEAGIATGVHYPVPIHLTPAYSGLGYAKGDLPVAESLAARSCSLPIGPLQTDEETARVARAVRQFEAVRA